MLNSAQHLLVLISIILGLGIREILTGARFSVVNARGDADAWLMYLSGLLVLIAIVQFWWYLFIVANRDLWGANFFLFAGTLVRPALLYISAASVFPLPGSDRRDDHYLRNRALIFGPLGLFEFLSFVESAINLGTIWHPAHGYHAAFITISIMLSVSRRRVLHRVLVPTTFILALAFIALFSLTLK